jgi:hypothetical protein
MCLPVTPPPPHPREREGERNKHFGLRERERSVSGLDNTADGLETFRVVSFSLPAILAAGSWRKGNTRGRPERGRLANSCLFLWAKVQRSRAGILFGSVLDAERRWPGAVREGAGQSGCGRSVHVRTVSLGACVDDNRYPLSARGAIFHLSCGAREIKTISKLSLNFNFYFFLQV